MGLGRLGGMRRDGAGGFVFRKDAIDAALVGSPSFVRFHLGPACRRKPVGVFDHVAIHVDNPQGSIGSGACHDGA